MDGLLFKAQCVVKWCIRHCRCWHAQSQTSEMHSADSACWDCAFNLETQDAADYWCVSDCRRVVETWQALIYRPLQKRLHFGDHDCGLLQEFHKLTHGWEHSPDLTGSGVRTRYMLSPMITSWTRFILHGIYSTNEIDWDENCAIFTFRIQAEHTLWRVLHYLYI